MVQDTVSHLAANPRLKRAKPRLFSIARSILLSILLLTSLSGCVSTIIGTAVDVTIEVAKVPFKVGGAVVDVVSGNDDD